MGGNGSRGLNNCLSGGDCQTREDNISYPGGHKYFMHNGERVPLYTSPQRCEPTPMAQPWRGGSRPHSQGKTTRNNSVHRRKTEREDLSQWLYFTSFLEGEAYRNLKKEPRRRNPAFHVDLIELTSKTTKSVDPVEYIDEANFPRGRSTGIHYEVREEEEEENGCEPTFESDDENGISDRNEGKAPPTGDTLSGATPSTLFTGPSYFEELSRLWRMDRNPHQRNDSSPQEYDEDDYDLDDSYIFDCIEESSGPPMEPPVPLPYMIDLLTPQWEDEGLYEVAQRGDRIDQRKQQEKQRSTLEQESKKKS